MNTPTTVSFSPTDYLRHCTLSWLLVFLLSVTGQAADLTFTPNAPIVEQGKQITLSVSGTSGEVTWTVAKGQIQGTGTQVTYVAPAQVGLDVVTAFDSAGNIGNLPITIMLEGKVTQTFSLENASWEVFTSRDWVSALLLSEDGKTLWIGTSGGLEKRDAITREIQQIFINTDGLPSNDIKAISSDNQGGLWVGTLEGLAHYVQSQWQVFKTDNSGLPDNWVNALLPDSQGGLWIGTRFGGLAHYAQGQWQVFKTDNSGLPDNAVTDILDDGQGGLWIGTFGGLVHYTQGQWQVFNEDHSDLPSNYTYDLLSDSEGGLWIDTYKGLVHYSVQAQWQVFNTDGLPSSWINTVLSDSQDDTWFRSSEGLVYYHVQGQWQLLNRDRDNLGLPGNIGVALLFDDRSGLWVGTFGGLAHYTVQGQWQVFNTKNSGLPSNTIEALLSDNQGGLWIGTSPHWDSGKGVGVGVGGGLAHYTEGQWQVFNTDNSGLPDNEVTAIHSDNQGGLWVGTWKGGLAHYAQGQWQVFNTDNSGLPDNWVEAILPDSQGGLWVGTGKEGLAYLSVQDQWQVLNTRVVRK